MSKMPLDTAGNILACIDHYAMRQPSARACTFLADGENAENILTYAQLHARATAMARAMPREVADAPVLLLFPSGIDFVVAFFACLYAGAIAVPANVARQSHHFSRLQAIIDNARARMVLTVPRLEPGIREGLQAFNGVNELLPTWTESTLLANAERRGPDTTALPPAVERIAFLQYTSGSTGNPKGVMVSHRQLVDNLRAIRDATNAPEHLVCGGWLPQFHDMGLIGTTLLPLSLGGHNPFISPLHFIQRPQRWLRLIDRYRIEMTAAPNFALELCAKLTAEAVSGIDLSSMNDLYCGAEPVRASTLRRFDDTAAVLGLSRGAVKPCYGLAEATLMVSGRPVGSTPRVLAVSRVALATGSVRTVPAHDVDALELVCCGTAVTPQQVIAVDPRTRRRCPADSIGELWTRGPSNASGYWRNTEATTRTFRARTRCGEDGFMRTGDLGFVLDGGVYVTGRMKDLIIVRGRNYYPADIEACAAEAMGDIHADQVVVFACLGDGHDAVAAVIEVARRDVPGSRDFPALASRVRSAVLRSHELLLGDIVFVRRGGIPRTSSGKVQRLRCDAVYGSEGTGPVDGVLFSLRAHVKACGVAAGTHTIVRSEECTS